MQAAKLTDTVKRCEASLLTKTFNLKEKKSIKSFFPAPLVWFKFVEAQRTQHRLERFFFF